MGLLVLALGVGAGAGGAAVGFRWLIKVFTLALTGHADYAGPRGLPGHGPHEYRFQVLALGRAPDFSAPPKLQPFLAAIEGSVLARGVLTGRFGR